MLYILHACMLSGAHSSDYVESITRARAITSKYIAHRRIKAYRQASERARASAHVESKMESFSAQHAHIKRTHRRPECDVPFASSSKQQQCMYIVLAALRHMFICAHFANT